MSGALRIGLLGLALVLIILGAVLIIYGTVARGVSGGNLSVNYSKNYLGVVLVLIGVVVGFASWKFVKAHVQPPQTPPLKNALGK